VLSLSHTLYPLFHILFPSLPLSLSPLSLSLSSFPFTGPHARTLQVAGYCSERSYAGSFRVAQCGRANCKYGVASALESPSADSLKLSSLNLQGSLSWGPAPVCSCLLVLAMGTREKRAGDDSLPAPNLPSTPAARRETDFSFTFRATQLAIILIVK
jgi:hypothetical protein